ncbi:hypothetical protein SAMN02745824_0083 [Parasphingorhabdus marina DSM 22363]|uniref:Uncharacterized protein n=1 Tax=Parasphingorhabdus marina DSM 22363 TaxID=1123272 RepID=A0A1N6CM37_9SPHN|nr:hypothetical protein [Parasphingorhabdus marina]SIN59555.1 hypothetical protein SAMN02745824_0083 [Parasphingorhabdus marina DSM 22363]
MGMKITHIVLPFVFLFGPSAGAVPNEKVVVPRESRSHLDQPDKEKERFTFSAPLFWQLMQNSVDQILDDMEPTLEPIWEELMAPTGSMNPDWQEAGVDVLALLSSRSGGFAGNALLSSGESPSITFFGRIPPKLLKDWQLIHAGENSTEPGEAVSGGFVALGKRHIVFFDGTKTEMLGRAHCTPEGIEDLPSHFRVYRDSRFSFDTTTDEDLDPEIEAMVLMRLFAAIDFPQICVVYEAAGKDMFREVTYNRNGEPLGNVDDGTQLTRIVQNFDLREQLTSKASSSLFDFIEEDAQDE